MVVLQEYRPPCLKKHGFLSKVFSIGEGKDSNRPHDLLPVIPRSWKQAKLSDSKPFWERGYLENPGFILNTFAPNM